jgi:PAS domain S-box-containing protein
MTYANQAVRDLTGLGPEVVVGKTLDENFPGLRAQGIPQRYAEVVRSQTAATFEDIIYGDDRMVRASFWVKAFPLPGGHVGVAFDNITERRRSEDLIREQEAFKSKMVENIGDVIVIIDSEGLNAYKSPNIERIFGWKPEEVVGKSTWDNVHPDDLEFGRRFIQDLLEEPGRVGTAEVRYKCRDGSFKWIEFTGSNLFNDPGIKGILGNYHDITERKAAVEEVKRQLAEKEVLLREVHHRVKNNIATVEGLLSFQADSTESPEAKAALQDSISRVRSICVLYDKLLLTTDYREISFRNYIESLLDSISAVFVEGRRFVVKKQIADFTIDSKKAVHVGIIINELMTNVFKYAFVGRDNGVISISVEKDGNAATLVIQDNGVGIDEKITSNGSPGLGFTIVKMMVKQLKGTYSAVNENGTRSTIRFEI